ISCELIALPHFIIRLQIGDLTRLARPLCLLAVSIDCVAGFSALGQRSPTGFLKINGRDFFSIGCYELPQKQTELREMADAGFNLVHCGNANDLNRAQAAGMMGWVTVPLELGADDHTMEKT